MDYINVNFDWLEDKLTLLKDKYVLFDFPGQVELYTHETSIHKILHQLQKIGYRVRFVTTLLYPILSLSYSKHRTNCP